MIAHRASDPILSWSVAKFSRADGGYLSVTAAVEGDQIHRCLLKEAVVGLELGDGACKGVDILEGEVIEIDEVIVKSVLGGGGRDGQGHLEIDGYAFISDASVREDVAIRGDLDFSFGKGLKSPKAVLKVGLEIVIELSFDADASLFLEQVRPAAYKNAAFPLLAIVGWQHLPPIRDLEL